MLAADLQCDLSRLCPPSPLPSCISQLQQAEAHVLQAEEDIRDEVVSEIQEVKRTAISVFIVFGKVEANKAWYRLCIWSTQ